MLGASHEEKENTGTNPYNTAWTQASDTNKDAYPCRQCDETFNSLYHLQQHALADHAMGVLAPINTGSKRPRSPDNTAGSVKPLRKLMRCESVEHALSPTLLKSTELDVNSNSPSYLPLKTESDSKSNENAPVGKNQHSLPPHLQMAASMSCNTNQKYLSPGENDEARSPMVSLLKAFQNQPALSASQVSDQRSAYVRSPLGSDGNLTDPESKDDNSSISSMGGNSGHFRIEDFKEKMDGSEVKPKKGRRPSLDDSHVKEIYKCTLCNKEFKQSGNFHNHMKTHSEVSKFCKCGICGLDFDCSENLQIHMRAKHTGANPYKCEHCNREFSQYNNLRRHLRVHREKIFKCKLCDREFNEEFYLTMHMGTHTGHRVYSCGVCNACFPSNHDLKNHVKTHSLSELHVCDVCGKAFSKACVLRQHKKAHSGERPYKCDRCSKTFIHRHHLTMHMRSHTDNKPFTCEICNREFTQSSHLYKHVRQHEDGTLESGDTNKTENKENTTVSPVVTKETDSSVKISGATKNLPEASSQTKHRRRSKAPAKQTTTADSPSMPQNQNPYGMLPQNPGMAPPVYPLQMPMGAGHPGYDEFYRAYMAQAQAYYNSMYMINCMAQASQGQDKPPGIGNMAIKQGSPSIPAVSLHEVTTLQKETSIGKSAANFSPRQDLSIKTELNEPQQDGVLNLSRKHAETVQDFSLNSHSKDSSHQVKESPFSSTSTSIDSTININQPQGSIAIDLSHRKSSQNIPVHPTKDSVTISSNSISVQFDKDIPKPQSVHHDEIIPSPVSVHQMPSLPSHYQSVHHLQQYPYLYQSTAARSIVPLSTDLSAKQSQTGSRTVPGHIPIPEQSSVNQSMFASEKQDVPKDNVEDWCDTSTYNANQSQKKENEDRKKTISGEIKTDIIKSMPFCNRDQLNNYHGQPWLSYPGYQSHCLGNQYLHEDEEIQDFSYKALNRNLAEGHSEPEDLSSRSSRQTTPTDLSVSRESTPVNHSPREATLSDHTATMSGVMKTVACSDDDIKGVRDGPPNAIQPKSICGKFGASEAVVVVEVNTEVSSTEQILDGSVDAGDTEDIDVVSCDTQALGGGDAKHEPEFSMSTADSTDAGVNEGEGVSDDVKRLRKKIAAVKKLLHLEEIKGHNEVSSIEEASQLEVKGYTEITADDSDDDLAERKLEIVTDDQTEYRIDSTQDTQCQKNYKQPGEEQGNERPDIGRKELNENKTTVQDEKQQSQTTPVEFQCDFCLTPLEGEASVSGHMMSNISCFRSLCESVGLKGISDHHSRKLLEMYQSSLTGRNRSTQHSQDSTHSLDNCESQLPQTCDDKQIQCPSRLSCGICWMKFKTKEDLEKHQTEHITKTNSSNACHFCDKTFVRPFDLQCHLMKYHQSSDVTDSKQTTDKPKSRSSSPAEEKEDGYSCTVCGENFEQLKFYKDHIETHTGTRPYKCSECGRGFSYKHNLNRHMMSHNSKSYTCEICGRSFKETFYLHMHMKIHAEEKNRRCEICGQHVPKSDLWQHMVTHLGSSEKNPTYEQIGERVKEILKEQNQGVPKNLSQGIPNILTKAFITEQLTSPLVGNSLEQFSNIVTLAEQGKLTVPQKTFSANNQSLDLSVKSSQSNVFTGETERLQKVNIGTEEVENIGKLATKMRDHGNHTCHICSQVFKTKREFGNHLGVHNGERTHICKECGKGFKKSCILRQHEKIHSGNRPYKCEVCGGTFLHYHHLQIHSRVHNGDRPYKCHVCGMGFKHSSNLPKHLKMHELEAENQSRVPENENQSINEAVSLHGQCNVMMDEEPANVQSTGHVTAEAQTTIPEFHGKVPIHALEIVNSA